MDITLSDQFKVNISYQNFDNSTFKMQNDVLNRTEEPYVQYRISYSLAVIIVSLYSIVMIISIGGNSIICYIIFAIRGLWTVPNFFIASLSISDIIMTCLCVPFTVVSNLIFYYWPFWDFFCPVVNFLQLLVVLQRTFTLVALTCDCHYVTWRPLKKRISKFKAKIVILFLWILAAIVSLPTAVNSQIVHMPYEPGSNGICSEKWDHPKARYWYSMLIMFLQYFVPLLIMLITYSHIGIIIWINRIPGEADYNRDRRLAASKRRTIKMFVVIVLYYTFAWLPLHVITLVGDTQPEIYDHEYGHILWLFSQLIAFTNAASNPIIYGWMNQSFRSGYAYVFSKLGCFKVKTHKQNSDNNRTTTFIFARINSSKYSAKYYGAEGHKHTDTEID